MAEADNIRGAKSKFFQNQKLVFCFVFGFIVFFLVFWFIGFLVYNLKKEKNVNMHILICALKNTKLLSQSPQIIK